MQGKRRKAVANSETAPPPTGVATTTEATTGQAWAAQVKHVRKAAGETGFPRAKEDAAVLAELEPLLTQAAAIRGAPPRALVSQINAVAAPSLNPTRQSERLQAQQQQQHTTAIPSRPSTRQEAVPPTASSAATATLHPAVSNTISLAATQQQPQHQQAQQPAAHLLGPFIQQQAGLHSMGATLIPVGAPQPHSSVTNAASMYPVMLNPAAMAAMQQQYMFVMSQRRC